LEFVWNLFGICLEFVWNLFGICLEFVWNLFGICLEFVFSKKVFISIKILGFEKNKILVRVRKVEKRKHIKDTNR
jgi:hypothetical protein